MMRGAQQRLLFLWGMMLHQRDNQIPTFRNNLIASKHRISGLNYLLTQRHIPE